MALPAPTTHPSVTPSTATSPQPFQPPMPEGPAILLIGKSGTGKTYCTTTLVDCGLEVFYFGTENRFMESVDQSLRERKVSMEKVHWMHAYPSDVPWDVLIRQVETMAALNYEGLTKIKTMNGKEYYNSFVDIYKGLSNYVDERTGKSFGPVDSWGPDRALVFDGISGAALMSLQLMQGGKPTLHEGEWGVAMSNLESLTIKLCSSLKCFFVMLGHLEREADDLTGGSVITVSTLGKKLSPKYIRHFSEVIMTKREGKDYLWDTMAPGVDLKRRILPLQTNIQPHFKPIVDAWKARLAQRSAT